MDKKIAFMFNPRDFIMDTLKMTYEQKGKYIQLICMRHDQGELSQSDIDYILSENDSIVYSKFSKNLEDYSKDIKIEKAKIIDNAPITKRNAATKKNHDFKKPSIDDLKEYRNSISSKIDVMAFYDYYESNGWKVGKLPMVEWQAAFRNWNRKQEREEIKQKPQSSNQNQSSYTDTEESTKRARAMGIIVI